MVVGVKKGIRFRVKPHKAKIIVPCAPELTTLLSCFAASGDMMATESCAAAAKSLHTCMASQKSHGRPPKPNINYLLRKLS